VKEIKAIIQPFMPDDVLHVLEQMDDLPGLTLSAVRGWGRYRAREACR
jgi:nitrogen regulatory protein P-II 1